MTSPQQTKCEKCADTGKKVIGGDDLGLSHGICDCQQPEKKVEDVRWFIDKLRNHAPWLRAAIKGVVHDGINLKAAVEIHEDALKAADLIERLEGESNRQKLQLHRDIETVREMGHTIAQQASVIEKVRSLCIRWQDNLTAAFVLKILNNAEKADE